VTPSSILPVATAAMAIAIFVFDTITDLEIAVAAFYVVVVLASVTFCQRRGIMLISAGCLTLTLLSFFLTRTGSTEPGLVNGVITLTAIGATTYLALRIVTADTELHTARERLAQVARVTALGELTASIAHEVNQPLAAVVTNANACSRWLAAGPPNLDEATRAVDRIVRDANRASDVVARVRALSRRTPPERSRININDIILETVTLAQTAIRRNHIWLRTELADELPVISGDRVQLQQVVLNLIMNGIEAIRVAPGDLRELAIMSVRGEAGQVLVSVQDSGTGLDPANADRIFEGFFTTKPEGMGMGLSICRSIIEAHGGQMNAWPRTPEPGAVFQCILPIHRLPA
jgi:C4-dicarboxylate-specific signal transduction histidine kinase